MAWSKATRIKVMLVIDIMFFFLELSVGFAVHSLALMADAFHMLNDILSLLVGLWAVSVASKDTTGQYTYGWQRAEILGAFFNAVFLIALCVSIILEALTRFMDPPKIGNAKLILIVGSLGLASNLVGFLVLGGHGHSHGPSGHDHDHDHEHNHDGEHTHADEHIHHHSDVGLAEEGRAGSGGLVTDESGGPGAAARHITFDREGTRSEPLEQSGSRASARSRGRDRRTPAGSRHGRLTSIEDISIHPASFRQEIIEACQPHPEEESSSEDSQDGEGTLLADPVENTPLLAGQAAKGTYRSHSVSKRSRRNSGIHDLHNHARPKDASAKSQGHGHSHGDMGMDGMILHVIGDALGNVGVIVTALIIWLTQWEGRYYADPAVSLFITLIILRSAIPLTLTTSKVLLQATPTGINADDVKQDIESLPGVESCHDVHIWQLSDTTIVASMHVRVKFPVAEKDGEEFMELSRRARKCFHAYGIHSATMQPEFWTGIAGGGYEDGALLRLDGPADATLIDGKPVSDVCLLECVDNCTAQSCCVATKPRPGSSRSGSHHSEHSHSEGSSHTHH